MGFLVGLIAMSVVFCVLLPLMAMLYIDILETKAEIKTDHQHLQSEIKKMEFLRMEIQRDKEQK